MKWTQRERESLSCTSWQLRLLLWDISFGFPLINHYVLPGSQFWWYQDHVCVCMHLLAKVDSTTMVYGNLALVGIISLWPPRSLFCMCDQRDLLTLGRKYVVWAGPSPLPLIVLFLYVEFCCFTLNRVTICLLPPERGQDSLYIFW